MEFVIKVGEVTDRFTYDTQEDMSDFLTYMLIEFNDDLNRVKKKDIPKN